MNPVSRAMEVFVASHPIFGKSRDVFGYELDFRTGFDEFYNALDGDTAGADLMAFVNYNELTAGKKGFICFPRRLLLADFPVLFDNRSMITAVSADLAGDEEVLSRCRFLKDNGYELAVVGVSPRHIELPLIELADFAAVDFTSADPDQRRAVLDALARRDTRRIARHVDAPDIFDQARSLGFDLFEGEFFTRPTVKAGKDISARKLTYLRLLKEVNNPALSYDEIADLVERDVALAYKLLKFMNSAWFGLQFEVTSVKHALVLLGPPEIRRWVSLVAVRTVGDDKPHELIVRSLTRAKAAEQVGWEADLQREASELFLMGMLSLMDALTDRPMEELLAKLPLSEPVKAALLGAENTHRNVFDIVVAYEQGDWAAFSAACERLGIDEQAVPPHMREAVVWARNALQEI